MNFVHLQIVAWSWYLVVLFISQPTLSFLNTIERMRGEQRQLNFIFFLLLSYDFTAGNGDMNLIVLMQT